MATAATIAARLMLDTKDYDAGIKSAEKSAGSFSDKMGKIGGSMLKMGTVMSAAVTTPIVAGLRKAVFAASDLGESISAVETVFGDASGTMLEFGETSAKAVGMSQEQFNSLGLVTGSLLQNLGYDAEGAADATVMLAERASDMAAVFNTDVSQALEAINSGLKGEMNPLEQFGVKLNAAGVNAKAMEMGLAATESELTDNAKAQAALAIIMEQTERIAGTFTEEAQSMGGSMRVLKAQLGDAAAQLGAVLLPIVTQAVNWFSQLVTKFQNLSPEAMKIIVIVAGIAAAIGPLLVVIGTLISAVGTISGAMAAAGVTIGGLLGPIAAVIAIVALLATAWKNNWFGIRDILTQVWEGKIKPAFEAVKKWLSVNIPKAIDTVKNWWENKFVPALQVVGNYIQSNILPVFRTIADFLSGAFSAATQALSTIWTNVLQPALSVVWEFISNSLWPLLQTLAEFLGAVLGLAIKILAGVWENILVPAIEVVWEFISNKLIPIFQDVIAWIADKLQPVIKGLSTAFDIVSDAIGKVIGWFKKLIDKIKNFKLPDWLTPGSPTPFEIGLWGINKAMKKLSKQSVPEWLTGNYSVSPPTPEFYNSLPDKAHGGGTTNNYNLTMPTSNSPAQVAMAFELLKAYGGT